MSIIFKQNREIVFHLLRRTFSKLILFNFSCNQLVILLFTYCFLQHFIKTINLILQNTTFIHYFNIIFNHKQYYDFLPIIWVSLKHTFKMNYIILLVYRICYRIVYEAYIGEKVVYLILNQFYPLLFQENEK